MSRDPVRSGSRLAGLRAGLIRRLGGAVLAAATLAAVPACLASRELDVGRPVMRLRWKLVTSDRAKDTKPQEFASVVTAGDQVFTGSAGGRFFSIHADDGRVRWVQELGAVSARPALAGPYLFVGTDDGEMVALEHQTGKVAWRYETRGPILEAPVVIDDGRTSTPGQDLDAVVVFSNEADQVYALDAETGKLRWQYRGETPEEYTLRGHAGVALAEGLVFTGFANGTMVALRQNTGSVAWLSSLSGEAERFVDADGTPAIHGSTVYITSSSGGAYALDRTTGLVRWRLPIEGAGGLAVERGRVYVAAANRGMHAVDSAGHTVWRQGTWGGGEPATPLISGSYVIYSLSEDGMFIADKRTGELYQYFDPGDGVSAPATVDGDRLYVLSNRAILYALDVTEF